MGLAFGGLGFITILAFIIVGWCMTSKGHLKDKIDELAKEIKEMKKGN